MKNKFSRSLLYVFLVVIALLVLYPLYFAFISSLKSVPEYTMNKLGLPRALDFGNYVRVLFRMHLLRYMLNTIITVSIAMVLYLIICSAAGLAFGQFRFKGKMLLFLLILFFQVFPQMVVAGELYQILSKIRLLNTRLGIILAWCAYFTPFGAYIMTTYFATVPKQIVESTRIDGANIFQLLFKIMMPIAKPMLGTIGVTGTLSMWNELPFASLILQNDGLRTLTVGIGIMQGEFGLPVPVLTAAVIVSAIVPTVLYFFFQNLIAMNATAGSLSGV